MRAIVFSSHSFENEFFETLNPAFHHELTFLPVRLDEQTVKLADGFAAVCCFAHDHLNAIVLKELKKQGTRFIALRSAGFNNVDLKAAADLKIRVARVPAYSPYSVAEHAVGLILTLNRKLHRAHARVHDLNFSLDGLLGFDLHGKVVGVIGTGKIGSVFAKIMSGFSCNVLAYDLDPDENLKNSSICTYTSLDELLNLSDIISLHIPLTSQTHHFINKENLRKMKQAVMLINTSRGALVDSIALIEALKNGYLGSVGLDVYEEEENIFFQDRTFLGIQDDAFARLLTFPNVFITAHQGFFTREALRNIVQTTLENLRSFENGEPFENELTLSM